MTMRERERALGKESNLCHFEMGNEYIYIYTTCSQTRIDYRQNGGASCNIGRRGGRKAN